MHIKHYTLLIINMELMVKVIRVIDENKEELENIIERLAKMESTP